MSRLSIVCACACVLVVALIAAFVWDYSHTKNQRDQARADLAVAQQNFAQCVSGRQSADAYAATLRGQVNQSQENCASALLRAQGLHDLALPPQITVSTSLDMGSLGMDSGAEGAFLPSAPAAQKTVNNTTAGGADAAFTNFLNAW